MHGTSLFVGTILVSVAVGLLLDETAVASVLGTAIGFLLWAVASRPIRTSYLFAGVVVGGVGIGMLTDSAGVGAILGAGVAFIVWGLLSLRRPNEDAGREPR